MGKIQSKNTIRIVLLLLVVVALYLKYFFNLVNLTSSVRSSALIDILPTGISIIGSLLLSVLLVFIAAVALNQAFFKEYIDSEFKNTSVVVFALMFSSLAFEFDNFFNVLVANVLLISAFGLLFGIFRKYARSYNSFFDASFLVALASMIYFQAIYFYAPLVLFLFYVKQKSKLRAFFLYCLGFIAAYFVLFSIFFFRDEVYLLLDFFAHRTPVGLPSLSTSSIYLGALFVLLFVSSYFSVQNSSELSPSTKTVFSFAFNSLLLLAVLQFILVRSPEFTILLFGFLSVLYTYYTSKLRFAGKLVVVLTIICLFFIQFPDYIRIV